MNSRHFLFFASVLFCITCFTAAAQTSNNKPVATGGKNYPATFRIDKKEFDALFAYKINDNVVSKANTYLNKAVVLTHVQNGDMVFLKLKLDYFKNAWLQVQVNGSYSTQVFILSDDKSVSYKGSFENGTVVMILCNQDEIVSE